MTESEVFFKNYGVGEFEARKNWYESQRDQIRNSDTISGGDLETLRLVEEQKHAYCHGLYFSTVILRASVIEQILHDMLQEAHSGTSRGDTIPLGGILDVFDESGHADLIDNERDDIDDVKQYRENIYHYRSPFNSDSPTRERASKIDDHNFRIEPEMFHDEAKHAVQTTMEVLEIDVVNRLQN